MVPSSCTKNSKLYILKTLTCNWSIIVIGSNLHTCGVDFFKSHFTAILLSFLSCKMLRPQTILRYVVKSLFRINLSLTKTQISLHANYDDHFLMMIGLFLFLFEFGLVLVIGSVTLFCREPKCHKLHFVGAVYYPHLLLTNDFTTVTASQFPTIWLK